MQIEEYQSYVTKDVYVASYLIAIGYKRYTLSQYEKQFTFNFTIDTSLEALEMEVDNYWGENTSVDAKRLFNAFKELKNRMFGGNK